jgi:hypothetical protein
MVDGNDVTGPPSSGRDFSCQQRRHIPHVPCQSQNGRWTYAGLYCSLIIGSVFNSIAQSLCGVAYGRLTCAL